MKISNPRLFAGDLALATQKYVDKISGSLLDYTNIVSSNLVNDINVISGNLNNSIEVSSGTLLNYTNTVSGNLYNFTKNVNDSLSSYVLSSYLFDTTGIIKLDKLPPISITKVTTIEATSFSDYSIETIDDAETAVTRYIANKTFEQGDVIVVSTKTLTNDNNELVGAYIVNSEKRAQKLSFPTPIIKSVNNVSPEANGNIDIKFALSGLSDYTDKNLSALYTQAEYISFSNISGIANRLGVLSGDTTIYYATLNELQDLDVSALRTDLNNLSGNVNNLSGQFNSLTNYLTNTQIVTVSSTIFQFSNAGKEILAANQNFDSTNINKYTFTLSDLNQNEEILQVYLMSADETKLESFYPDITKQNNLWTITVLASESDIENKKIKIVYSNYKTLINNINNI